MDPDIYQKLWESDANAFSVSPRLPNGEWQNSEADILLDEQVKAGGRRDIDLAPNPLFFRVNEAKLAALPTYSACIRLLDNYIVNYRREETVTAQEQQELEGFLDLILPTEPMSLAITYVRETLRQAVTADEWRTTVARIWFTPFTNYFNGVATNYCSGFEHVFVGEGKYDIQLGAGATRGEVSGYHNWIKFYLDERNRRVDFRGYKYDLQGSQRPSTPNVVTLQMIWTHQDIEGNVLAELFKKTGGFFVGLSPECQIAMGAMLFYESQSGVFPGDRRHTVIDQDRYNLVLYRSVDQQGRRGDYIRSLFPEFTGTDGRAIDEPEPGVGRTVVTPVGRVLRNDGPVRIVSALINPTGADEGNETVTLENRTGTDIDLAGWELRDASARSQALSGTLAAGQRLPVRVTRATPDSMQLGNRGGRIELYHGGERIASVSYGSAREGSVVEF